jgi:hypothetical protein
MLRRRAQSNELLRAMGMPLRNCCAIVMVAVGVSCATGAPAQLSVAPMPFQPPQPLAVQPAQPMPPQIPRQMPYQQPPAAQVAPAPAALPEPIYWKQLLFLIPYQWGSAAEPGAARAVWLFVSKDRGASWQKISEAKPDVKAFNYRAEGDGEYWFAVRTFDKQGRAWPQGPYQPELRVIVDTTLPRIDELRAQPAANGAIDIQARVADSNLDPNTWRFEWQADAAGAWQPVVLQGATVQPIGNTGIPLGGSALHALWQPLAGTRPMALRGTVMDRAGNSATYQTRLDGGPAVSGPLLTSPGVSTAAARPAVPAASPPPIASLPSANALEANSAAQGWVSVGSGSAPAGSPGQTGQPTQTITPPATQPWPAANTTRAPFQLWTSAAPPKDDGVTAYGSPQLFAAPPVSRARPELAQQSPRVEAKYAGIAKPQSDSINVAVPTVPSRPQFAALEPYRESAAAPPVVPSASAPPAAPNKPIAQDVTPIDSPTSPHSPPSPPKLVGSRTFALEYDLDDAGRGGVSKVELWGSRDGGKSWNRYAQDDDNRSPLIVTVDEEGLYGFRIVVQNAGAAVAETPRPGDAPELWVSVDLKRPVVELTAIERGQGNVADHLMLRWRATDNNLEPRPIALFYSSHAAGPWSAIATNLENTGEYAWRVERYVPARFYLRIEARDTPGNMAAFQTREPVEFSTANLTGRLRSAESLESAATRGSDSRQ